jgi:hypothetical protein
MAKIDKGTIYIHEKIKITNTENGLFKFIFGEEFSDHDWRKIITFYVNHPLFDIVIYND